MGFLKGHRRYVYSTHIKQCIVMPCSFPRTLPKQNLGLKKLFSFFLSNLRLLYSSDTVNFVNCIKN